MKYLPLSLNASFLYIIVIVLSSALVATAAVGSGDGAPSHPTRIHFAAPLHTVSTTRRTTTTTSSSSFRQCQHTTTCCFIIPSRFHRGRNDDETLSRGLLRLGVLKDEGGRDGSDRRSVSTIFPAAATPWPPPPPHPHFHHDVGWLDWQPKRARG